MKLLSLFLLAGTLSLSAASNAQNAKVSLSMSKATLEDILWKIQEKTDVQFLYSTEDVKNVKGLDLDINNKLVTDVLEYCLKNTGLEYKVSKGTVVIQRTQNPVNTKEQKDEAKDVIILSGRITDKQGLPIPGASVSVKANALFGTVTDQDGKFTMTNVPRKSTIVFSFIGYNSFEINASKASNKELSSLKIVMEESLVNINEVTITASGSQRKVSIIGAISTLNPQELRTPSRSLATTLAGKVSGVSFSQQSGQPGKDGASFIIRGINSVSGNSAPLILIDGIKRNLEDVDPNDVESFTVLKDASATAVYGLEGNNGIIVITTKSGKVSERPDVRISVSSSLNNVTNKPSWVDAVDYANLKNEAYVVRGKLPYYNPEEITKFGDGNNDTYPNVDWYKAMVKPNNRSNKVNLNLGGGGNVVTYYMSAGYYTEDGMFKGGAQGYETNAKYNQFNFRSNLKADISTSTTLAIGFDGRYNTSTEPGQGADNLLGLFNQVNPTLFPPEYSNGTSPVEPEGVVNPYALLNKTGFKKIYSNIMSTNINLSQKLDFIAKGLAFNTVASFSKNNYYEHQYIKNYKRYRIDYVNSVDGTGYDADGKLLTSDATPELDDKMKFQAPPATGDRTVEIISNLNYNQVFFNSLTVGGLVLYKQREFLPDIPGGAAGSSLLLINALPARNQSLAGRVTIDFKNKYFMDLNYGFAGSQLFTKDKRFSPFPSAGIGWMISEEPFWAGLKKTFSLLKLRSSYGITGSPGSATRYGYLATSGPYAGYTFGFGGSAFSGTSIQGFGETSVAQLNLGWEQNYKIDIGFELGLFNQVKLVTDFFHNTNKNQLIALNRLPATLGLPATPSANLGEMESKGFDIDLTYSKDFGDFKINYIKGIVTYNTNKIIENGQYDPKMPYQSGLGLDWGRSLNYVALGLFKDQTDIDNSPVQTWLKDGVQPGDIKYKDINGDGVISAEDRIWLGNVNPKWTYSMAIDLSYNSWTFAARLIGKGNMFRSINGGRIPFNASGVNGAVYQAAMNDHWTPASYSGDPATENPNAEYPRLGYGSFNDNNNQQSTFWLREASYFRCSDLELGYTWVPANKKLGIKNIYFYGKGSNLAVFSKFKDWDPEQTNSNAYPLKSTFSIGAEIGLKL